LSNLENDTEFIIKSGGTLTLNANKTEPPTVKSGLSLRFDIVKFKTLSEIESVSPVKNEALTIVNINQVRSIEIADIGKVYIPTINSDKLTGDAFITTPGAMYAKVEAYDFSSDQAKGLGWTNAHLRKVTLTGKYGSEDVVIPADYVAVTTGSAMKLELNVNPTTGAIEIVGVTDELKWKDLYDITTARYTRKDAEDTISVTVFNSHNKDEHIDKNKLTVASKVVNISDAKPVLTTISGKDKLTVNPDNTVITSFGSYKYKDQYGVDITPDLVRFRISDIVENADGYTLDNFRYEMNDTRDLKVIGAERGDKFVVTVIATKDGVTVSYKVEVTVGADKNAKLTSDSGNIYLNKLVPELESNRR